MAGLPNTAVAQAMVANARWSTGLGWSRYIDAIDVLLAVPACTTATSAVFAAGWLRRDSCGR